MVENLKGEIWKPVVGYEGKYEVSNLGRIKSLSYLGHNKNQILKTQIVYGYEVITLWRKDVSQHCRIHRLVYEAFNGKLPKWTAKDNGRKRMEINHINEITTDNRLENLELITHAQNIVHSKRKIAESHYKQIYQYTKDKKLIRILKSGKEGKIYGFNPSSISRCCKNNFGKSRNVYKEYIWSYTPLV